MTTRMFVRQLLTFFKIEYIDQEEDFAVDYIVEFNIPT